METHSERSEQTRSFLRANVATPLHNVDGTDVVCVDDSGADHTTKDLCENVSRDFAPGEVTEGRKRNRHSRIDVSS